MAISELDAAHDVVASIRDVRSQHYVGQVLQVSQLCVRRTCKLTVEIDLQRYSQAPEVVSLLRWQRYETGT